MHLNESEMLQGLMTWRTKISAAAWLILRDTHAAEDVFQSVVLKALTRDVRFETEAALVSWAFISSRREALDWLRRHKRETLGLEPDTYELLAREWQLGASPCSGARIDALRDCLATASESSQRLLTLRYFDGYTCEQVANELGLGLDVIYKRISRLHQSLKECVDRKLAPGGIS